jgi:hypothetical protein
VQCSAVQCSAEYSYGRGVMEPEYRGGKVLWQVTAEWK